MMPGMGRMNPRQVKQAMKRLGIKTEEMENVVEVVIRTRDKQYLLKDVNVQIMEMQGQRTYQIVAEKEEVQSLSAAAPSKAAEPVALKVPEEDVKLVMDQTGATREKAIEALIATDGQPAEAILKIISS
jgi:nascent polypeptide-associated complex subunit alpha